MAELWGPVPTPVSSEITRRISEEELTCLLDLSRPWEAAQREAQDDQQEAA